MVSLRTVPSTTLLNKVFLSFSFTSKSIKVNLLVLTWKLSFVHSAPENLKNDHNKKGNNSVRNRCHTKSKSKTNYTSPIITFWWYTGSFLWWAAPFQTKSNHFQIKLNQLPQLHKVQLLQIWLHRCYCRIYICRSWSWD